MCKNGHRQTAIQSTMRGLCTIVKIAVLLPIMGVQGGVDIANRPCCREAPSVTFSDTVPLAASNGSCVFTNTLCSYTQGCADPSMSRWTPRQEYASANQTTPSHHEDWTILVSALLEVSQDCCFIVNYGLYGNASMDAFWETIHSGRVVPLFKGKEKEFRQLTFNTETTTIGSLPGASFGRIKVRAKATGTQSAVFLYSISLQEGRCGGHSCTFNEGLCEWKEKNWTRTWQMNNRTTIQDSDRPSLGQFVRLDASFGRLTTPTIRVTSGLTDCVRFRYMVRGDQTELKAKVYVIEADRTNHPFQVWNLPGGTTDVVRGWKTGTFPVGLLKDYKIRFFGRQEQNDASAIVALDQVIITTDSACKFEPPEAEIKKINLLSTLPTTPSTTPRIRSIHTSLSQSSISTVSKTTEEDQHGGSTGTVGIFTTGGFEDEGGPASVVVIGGSVAGALVLLIVLVVSIIACLVCRRRQNKRKSQGQIDAEYEECSPTDGNGTRLSAKNDTADRADVPNSRLLAAPDTDTYTDIDDADISPRATSTSSSGRRSQGGRVPPAHEPTYDVCSRSARLPAPRTATDFPPVAQQQQQQQQQPEEDLYNNISSCSSGPHTTKSCPGDTYHHTDTPSGSSHRPGSNNPPAGTGADARGRTPAANSGQFVSSAHERSSLATSSPSARNDKPQALCHPPPRAGSPRPKQEGAGDYNVLQFDGAGTAEGAGRGDLGRRRPAEELYDHVLNGPEDIYNTTRTATRDVVLDSTYDHVKL